MSDSPSPSSERGRGAPRSRSRSRGGLGKYLRARGRGHRGGGRPAEFKTRLVLEGEEYEEIDPDSEEAKAERAKYSRRQLGSNADRYEEPEEVQTGGDDEDEEKEPEIDMSAFEERVRNLNLDRAPIGDEHVVLEGVDHSLARFGIGGGKANTAKGRVQKIEWDEGLEQMARERAIAEAHSALKARLRAKSETLKKPPTAAEHSRRNQTAGKSHTVEAPPLPLGNTASPHPSKKPKEQMEDFLDDLLA